MQMRLAWPSNKNRHNLDPIPISFIFGPLREGTMGFRIFAGVIVGIVFRTSEDLLGPASLVFGFPPLYAAVTPIIVCLLAGLLMLRKTG